MQHQNALLLNGLRLREPHVRPRNRFADCFGIGCVVLLGLHIGLHVGRRHEPDPMAQLLDRAGPMMRGRAGLDADQARFEPCEEGLDLRAAELTAEDLLALCIDAVGVKDVLSDIEADCDWLHHLTSSISCPKTLPVFGAG